MSPMVWTVESRSRKQSLHLGFVGLECAAGSHDINVTGSNCSEEM